MRSTSELRVCVAAAVMVRFGVSMSAPLPMAPMLPLFAVEPSWFVMMKRLALPATPCQWS